jgi:hypothetical protein
VVRVDSDGDGLSDAWEKINGRDPDDGRLSFTFDCGGWQTEGWQAKGDLGNIAGRQGYLDFVLKDSVATIVRDGLNVQVAKNRNPITLSLRNDHEVRVKFSVLLEGEEKPRDFGSVRAAASDHQRLWLLRLPTETIPAGRITSLQAEFAGEPGTLIEIDSIMVR